MKKFIRNMKLEINTIAADGVVQGTKGAGGKSEEVTEEPCHVYVATLRGTKKIYIGITKRKVTDRWTEHCRETIKKSSKFGKALQEFGPEAFDWEWLGTFASRKEAGEFERHCTDNELGDFNTAPGGGGGYDTWTPLSEHHKSEILAERNRWFRTRETRAKTAAALKGRPSPNKGRKLSHCKNLSISHRGKKQSPETIAKRIATQTRNKIEKLLKQSMGPIYKEVVLDG